MIKASRLTQLRARTSLVIVHSFFQHSDLPPSAWSWLKKKGLSDDCAWNAKSLQKWFFPPQVFYTHVLLFVHLLEPYLTYFRGMLKNSCKVRDTESTLILGLLPSYPSSVQLCKSFCSWRTKTRWQRERSEVCGEEELLRSRPTTKKNRFWSVYSQFAVKFHLEQEMWMEGRKPLKQNPCAKRNTHTTVWGGVFPRSPSTLTWEEEDDEEGKTLETIVS
jgi:hypothetical protein